MTNLSPKKLISWNVNGIRAAAKNGFLDFLKLHDPDVICLQEIKAFPDQLDFFLRQPEGYSFCEWNSAEKAGYGGTAILSKQQPISIKRGMDLPEFDNEGRVITFEFSDYYLVNAYFPNSQRDHARLSYKLKFCHAILNFCNSLKLSDNGKIKGVVLCGDYNIAHTEIDLANPKTNIYNAGFLPDERNWMSLFLNSGYCDIFRKQNPGNGYYTWWSYRPGVREKNIGWRLDYHCVSTEIISQVKRSYHLPDTQGSDHCPIGLELY